MSDCEMCRARRTQANNLYDALVDARTELIHTHPIWLKGGCAPDYCRICKVLAWTADTMERNRI